YLNHLSFIGKDKVFHKQCILVYNPELILNHRRSYQLLFTLAGLFLLIGLSLAISGNISLSGPFIIGFFVALAIAFRGYAVLTGSTYATVRLAAVTTARYWPDYFVPVGDYQLSGLISPVLQIIMFGMGTGVGV